MRRYTDMPMLVMLEERDGYYAAGRCARIRPRGFPWSGEQSEWKTVAFDEKGDMTVPNGSSDSAGATKANGTSNSATVKLAKRLSYV